MKKIIKILLFGFLLLSVSSNAQISSVYTGGNGGGYMADSTNGAVPLPVELVSLSANVYDGSVVLTWSTATEIDNYGFEVERSVVKDQWKNIGFVQGAGNSNSPKNYEFTDSDLNGYSINYRLKQIDNDGDFEYSASIEVQLDGPEKYELAQNFPNPFNPETNIMFTIKEKTVVKLSVFNILGETVAVLANEVKDAGSYSVRFDASNLNTGVYFYQLETKDFTQVNKMMFVK